MIVVYNMFVMIFFSCSLLFLSILWLGMTAGPDVIRKDIIICAQVKEACIEVNEQLDVKKGMIICNVKNKIAEADIAKYICQSKTGW